MDNSTISESPTHPFQIGNWWVDESGGFHSAYGIDSSIDTFLFRVIAQSGVLASESSGDQIDVCYLNTVFELYSSYHLGQVIEAA